MKSKMEVKPHEYQPLAKEILALCVTKLSKQPTDKELLMVLAALTMAQESVEESLAKMGFVITDSETGL